MIDAQKLPVNDSTHKECLHKYYIYDYTMGEIFYGTCGFVIAEHLLDLGPEWRAFTLEEQASKSRCGTPSYTTHSRNLATTIRQADLKTCPRHVRQEMWRLIRLQTEPRWGSSFDRNLSKAESELNRLSDKIRVPPRITQEASRIYRKALRHDLARGRNIVALAAAALYAACRLNKVPRTLHEIEDASLISKKSLTRSYNLLLRKLDLKPSLNKPIRFLARIAEKNEISCKAQGLAIKILRTAGSSKTLQGKDPRGLAAAALYLACRLNNEKKTQKDLAKGAGVTEVTLRKNCLALRPLIQRFLES